MVRLSDAAVPESVPGHWMGHEAPGTPGCCPELPSSVLLLFVLAFSAFPFCSHQPHMAATFVS